MNKGINLILDILLVVVSFFIGFVVGVESRKENDFASYERGAWAVVQYHKYNGNYGSQAYREIAFKWGDPQDQKDVEEIDSLAYDKYKDFLEIRYFWVKIK